MGRCYTFTADHADFTLLGLNDVASSIRFAGSYAGRYQVTLFEHTYYGGRSYTLNASHADFKPSSSTTSPPL
jgi:glutamate-1-semialdehyde aminotransferase